MNLCIIFILVFSISSGTSEEYDPPYFLHNNELTRNAQLTSYNYNSYLTYSQMQQRLALLRDHYPDKVTLQVAGKSVEQRDIYLVIITDKLLPPVNVVEPTAAPEGEMSPNMGEAMPNNSSRFIPIRRTGGEKPVIFVDAGIHAREWVAPAAAFYLIDKILETPHLTSNLEWQIIPIVNPDGYEFSRTKSRLWRKNRGKTSNRRCRGVDLNRNFDVHFGRTDRNACSETYGGPRAFSEPESRAVRDSLIKTGSRTQAYVTFHTYGQLILHPYGYTKSTKPATAEKLIKMGQGMANTIYQKYKNPYRVLQASAIGAAAGGSDDWAFIKMKIPYSYTFELQDRVNNRYQFTSRGFILPARKLLQAVDECWIGMKYLGEQILLEQGLAHRIVDLPPSPVSINGEEDYESGEAEGEEQEREEPYISAYPFGLEQVIKEVQGLQAEIEQRNLNEKKENCVERGNVFICPHMVFWGSMFGRDLGTDK
ncbi:UNVERIFIED_CONTAM: hypothetical protein RMT77_007123 [Armadillidium vulgare]